MKEDELFMELLKDIANELDIDVLCHKIMVNVGFLTNADRGSLFLAKGPLESRYLVTKLFDVTVDSGTCFPAPLVRPRCDCCWLPFHIH
jgi:cGMP-specific 3',5'-cyclic phosphodiesterase